MQSNMSSKWIWIITFIKEIEYYSILAFVSFVALVCGLCPTCLMMENHTKVETTHCQVISAQSTCQISDFAKYVGPTVKSDRNLIGPIKPTSFSDQMSAIVRDWLFVFTDVRSWFPHFSFVAWFPVKVKFLFIDWNTSRGTFRGKKRMVNTSDGAECKRNQKYEANRVERTPIAKWKTGRPWLLLKILWHNNVIMTVVYKARTRL